MKSCINEMPIYRSCHPNTVDNTGGFNIVDVAITELEVRKAIQFSTTVKPNGQRAVIT